MAALDLDVIASRPTTSAEFKAALSRIAAELHRRVQASPTLASVEYFSRAAKAISSIRGASQLELRMRALMECSTYFYLNDLQKEAVHVTQLLIQLANKAQDQEWIRRGHHYHGMALAESGRIADAVIAYATALRIARESGDTFSEAKTLINLGAAFNFGSLYRESIPCLETALRKCAQTPAANTVEGAALSNLAEAHYFLGEYGRAYDLIQLALKQGSQTEDAFGMASLAVRQFIAFKIAIDRGDLISAQDHGAWCMKYAHQSGSVRSTFTARLADGLIQIYKGNTEIGFTALTELLGSSRHNAGPYYEEALAALVRAYDKVGEPELALEHMEARLRHLSSLRRNAFGVYTERDESELATLQLTESRLRTKVAERTAAQSRLEMFERLAVTADLKEEASGEHGYRVGRLSALMAEELGWSKEACRAIDMAARLHDIGKIAMPDRILLTSEQLKEAERHIMSTHTLVGAELLAKSNIPQLQMAEEIAKFHHEWWNGEGYPARRREKRIPIHARIVALADVFDALTHGRPFAEPWPMDRALEEIRNRRGTQFDPELTDLFLELVARLRTEHADLDDYLGKAGRNSPFLQARQKIRLMLADPPTAGKKAPEAVH